MFLIILFLLVNTGLFLELFKLLEIYNLFNITDYKYPINTFHLAEGLVVLKQLCI